MASIYEQALAFRRQLIERDSAAVEFLTDQYKVVYASVLRSLAALNEQIAAAQASGQEVSKAWLNQQWRYQSLLRQMDAEFRRYGEQVAYLVRARQLFEANQGSADAGALIQGRFDRLPVAAIQNVVGNLRAGSPLAALLDSFGPVASRYASEAILEAVTTGKNPRAIAGRVRDALGVPLHRALLISRTEAVRAYRQGSLQSYQDNGIKQWRWVAAKSPRTCLNCLARDGEIYEVEKPFPAHPACIPAGALIHSPEIQSTTSRFYRGKVVEFLTTTGKRLTVTPNHPILTSRGWVAAALINESDHIVSTDFAERVIATVNPDKQEIPASIEQVVSSFLERSGVLSVSMPSAAEDFHGDGMDSEINVVAMNRLLRNGFNAAGFEPFSQNDFIGRSPDLLRLASFSSSDSGLNRIDAAAGSFVCGDCVSAMLFGRSVVHHQPIGFGDSTYINTSGYQSATDAISRDIELIGNALFGSSRLVESDDFIRGNVFNVSVFNSLTRLNQQAVNHLVGDSESASERAARLTGLIEFDKVWEIRKREFSGHVYNLQTAKGWYIANGIITHNCRCTMIPVIPSIPTRAETAGEWFAKQPDSVKRQMMSGKAFDLYKRGEITLADFKGERRSRKWGASTYERSVKEILGE